MFKSQGLCCVSVPCFPPWTVFCVLSCTHAAPRGQGGDGGCCCAPLIGIVTVLFSLSLNF